MVFTCYKRGGRVSPKESHSPACPPADQKRESVALGGQSCPAICLQAQSFSGFVHLSIYPPSHYTCGIHWNKAKVPQIFLKCPPHVSSKTERKSETWGSKMLLVKLKCHKENPF